MAVNRYRNHVSVLAGDKFNFIALTIDFSLFIVFLPFGIIDDSGQSHVIAPSQRSMHTQCGGKVFYFTANGTNKERERETEIEKTVNIKCTDMSFNYKTRKNELKKIIASRSTRICFSA